MSSLSYLFSYIVPSQPPTPPDHPIDRTSNPIPNFSNHSNRSLQDFQDGSGLRLSVSSEYLPRQGLAHPIPQKLHPAMRSTDSLASFGSLNAIERPQRIYMAGTGSAQVRFGVSPRTLSSPERQVHRQNESLSPPPSNRSSLDGAPSDTSSELSSHAQMLQDIFNGKEVTISHHGSDSSNKPSALLTAMNHGRLIIRKERDGIRDKALLVDMMHSQTIEVSVD